MSKALGSVAETVPCAACWTPVDIGDMSPKRAWYCSRLCAAVAERIPEGSTVRAMLVDAGLCSCCAISSLGVVRGWHTPACFVSARVSRAAYLASLAPRSEAR